MEPAEISVIIPAAGPAPFLIETVRAARGGPAPEPVSRGPGEVLVVDDGLDPGVAKAVGGAGAVVVPNCPGFRGPASARNTGARAARGTVLCFIDSDVIVPPGFFERLVNCFVATGADGVIALQSAETPYDRLASIYKNLWMRYTYERLDGPVDLFYTSAAAIKRAVFEAAGGFDENYTAPSVEDTAFGCRLARVRARVVVAKELEVDHRKEYDVRRLLRLAFTRGARLTRFILREGQAGTTGFRSGRNRTSVPTGYVLSLPFAAALVAWAPVYAFAPRLATFGFFVHLLFLYLFNLEWLVYLGRGGVMLVLFGMAVMPAEMLFGFLGGVWGLVSYACGRWY